MKDFRKHLSRSRLYLVLDREVSGYDELLAVLKKAVSGGVDVVQLRDKHGSARDILNFSKQALKYLRRRIPFILNDRLDLALAVGADGVHLGQEDLPLRAARRLAGHRILIGVSCQTLEQALSAQRHGADYLGFGSVFPTLTKPERRGMDLKLLVKAAQRIKIPLFPIGGINLENLARLRELGIRRVAVTRSICLAKDAVAVTKLLRKTLE